MWVVYWTDGLMFGLVGMVIVLAWHARGREDLRASWRYVLSHRTGLPAALVLSAYLLVALLDCIHYVPGVEDGNGVVRYAARAQSVFDTLTGPLRRRVEKTYSAPLATHGYATESIDGSLSRSYPRLRYGGSHLLEPAVEWSRDVTTRLAGALLLALGIWTVIAAGCAIMLARRGRRGLSTTIATITRGQSAEAWRSGLATLGLILLFVCSAWQLSPYYHVLGTDKVGQDVLYQSLKSVRAGILIGTLTTLVMLPIALFLGVAAGYFGGWVDDVVQYVYTTLNSIPGVLLIAAAILILQVHMETHAASYASLDARADLRLLWLCIILGMTNWTGLCRLLRGEALKLREAEFVLAARVMGATHRRILLTHIVPNVMHIVLISVVLDFSGLVLAEAVLSYVNIGVDPTMNSWGNMINSARLELAREPIVWWSLASAFAFMSVLVLAANLFADVVRDAFDPRLRAERLAQTGSVDCRREPED